MRSPSNRTELPWGLAGAIGLVIVVLLFTLAPRPWLAPGLVAVAAMVLLLGSRDRSARSRRETHARHTQRTERLNRQIDGLRRATQEFTSILAAVPMPTLVISSAGGVVSCNPAGGRLLGRAPLEVLGAVLEDLLPQQELLTLFDQARSGDAALARVRLTLDGQARFYDVTATPIAPAEDGSAAPTVVLCLDDVTPLQESTQLKTDFAANASHELRTPIAAIRGAVETLTLARDDPEMTQRLTEIIARHAARLEALVADLLDLSRLESEVPSPNPEPVDLAALTDRLIAQCAEAPSQRGVSLNFETHGDLTSPNLDRGLLELMLRNLIENAGRFAHPGTAVCVITEPIAQIHGVRFRVIDRGQGIPLKHQERVFERFFQVDPGRDAQSAHRGTGLGLAIVKHAVKRLGGRVEIQSVLHEGTTVTVEIPDCVGPEVVLGAD